MANLVALVTGANKGLGFEICRQLAAKGYSIILTARDIERGNQAVSDLKQQGFDAHFVQLDMEDASTFDSAYTFVEQQFGKLDALVNNAGFAIDWEKADTVPLELIRKTFDANFFGLIDLTQRFIPLLKKSPAGRIVNAELELFTLWANGTGSLVTNTFSEIMHSIPHSFNEFALDLAASLQAKNFF
jgi:NAD(P)-dependent dehydrogenase (short-subunit alcohol dehydrogenase family)